MDDSDSLERDSTRRAGLDEAIEAIAAAQRSLFTRAQAAGVGFRSEQIEHRLATRRWSQPHHLVYALLGAQFDAPTELLAAVFAAQPKAHASFCSAAALVGIPGFHLSKPSHVTVADHWERDRTPAVLHRTNFLPPHHRRVIKGVPCTSVGRTIFDLCGSERIGRSARALDNALSRRLITVPALWTVLAETKARGRAGSRVLRLLLQERGIKYIPPESELERRFVELARDHGLPEPRRQVDLGNADEWIGRVDFLIAPHLVVEVDGSEHHTSLLDVTADAVRDALFAESGLTVLRFTWNDVTRRSRHVAATIRRHLAAAA